MNVGNLDTALLSSAYFGPVQWYQKLHRHERVLIEHHDSFVKQTYRNRCIIATANGPQTLTIPTEHNASTEGCHTRISDHGNWRHLHWNALVSAYSESPFFEYYADDIRPFFERRTAYLYDFNMEITLKMCELLDIEPPTGLTDRYITDTGDDINDFRDIIRPKHPVPDSSFHPLPYYQVYARRHGFMPNMSILDLLFNMGNESIFYL